ncbi:hypothetical protein S40285_00593 [Stachybotrys chlorohalonatus IBT 40285]|uniref:Uncharacterized protein n=1 Tax=Stachybotrys chlorohalonatus (strain IBT 40285) TaxID=1283841 RepID=A0A084R2U1_STAC4|nr:hypothetical protein S40285_00593 [Stachybotrys chlorohalonata IBT 40285]
MAPPQDDEISDHSSSEGEGAIESDVDIATGKNSWTPVIADKDSDEEELERLVLGDKAGFRENLFKPDLNLYNDTETQGQLATTGGVGLEDVEDMDLFMMDTGAPRGAAQAAKASQAAQTTEDGDAPAWEDSDDERLTVSLANATRLRKLRLTEADDLVSGAEYSRRLRQQYLRLHPLPAWAREASEHPAKRRRRSSAASNSSDASDDSDGDDVSAQPLEKFLRDVNKLAGLGSTKKRRLRPETIDIQRTRPIPDKHRAAVESLSFHPKYPVLLSASTSSVLFLHHIAPGAQPTPNPQLTSVQAKQVDVRRAEFLYPAGEKIFFAGRRRYFHHWDLQSGIVQKTNQILGHRLEHKTMEKFKMSPCGRYMAIAASTKKGGGIVNIISAESMQWIAAAQLSSHNGIADFAWWSTGGGLTILGRDGQVGEYSIESRSFLGVWVDEGCVGGIVIALGGGQGPAGLGDDHWVAVGSSTGITNIYDRNELVTSSVGEEVAIQARPTPKRTFEQLITPITVLTFSPDGQLLAFGSRESKDALKLVHLPSCTVYRNWPTEQTPLGRVTAVAFGRDSDVLAVGNDAGHIRLWEIRS